MKRPVFGQDTLDNITKTEAQQEQLKLGDMPTNLWIGQLIYISDPDKMYRVDAVCKCDDGTVFHATALGIKPIEAPDTCFLKAAQIAGGNRDHS